MNMIAVKYISVVCCILNYLPCHTTPASHHIGKSLHQHEREEDGAYSPRDHAHVVDGVHHSEFDHEAILGSAKEAEEFDHLSPEEAKRRLAILLKKMDLNSDGFVSRNELHAWILRSLSMLSEEESEDRFEDADENEDGVVTWQEYISDSYGIQDSDEEDNEIDDNSEEKLISDDKIMFRAADGNGDGVLNKQEFLKFSHPEEHPEMLPVVLKQTLDEKDANKDGFIDFQEFVGERGAHHDKEWLLVEKEKFDHEFDKDKDGRLNPAEILAWIVPSNDEVASEEVSHLFASSDGDHDDLLSYGEVLEHHEVFVGSEATDYGDHLHNIHTFQDEL
ncbi:reticulocalbin-2 [Bacillus rossius redtenbacheri]|uniref:reticulocalbin-2 n=1 Tax=Bacillus rossius redtenbacheri TaxID=93214 RepID=UPI002FDD3B9E